MKDMTTWKLCSSSLDILNRMSLQDLQDCCFYYEKLRSENADYLVCVEFQQHAQEGDGQPFPREKLRDTKKHRYYRCELPKYEFVCNGFYTTALFEKLPIKYKKMVITTVATLIENGGFVKDFKKEDYDLLIVRVLLNKDSKYWVEEIIY